MIIRKEALEELAVGDKEAYISRLTVFLRDEFPDARVVPVRVLREDIVRQLERAAGYGLETEQQAATYTVTAWLLGRDFDAEYPEAHSILGTKLPSDLKAERLAAWSQGLFEA